MKQPIITRNLERKAVYSDLIYDPEWFHFSIEVDAYDEEMRKISVCVWDCDYDFVIDWGDGNIEKNGTSHKYIKNGIYIIRIKGYIYYTEGSYRSAAIVTPSNMVREAILYGHGFNTDLPVFRGCSLLEKIHPNFFQYRSDLTSLRYFFDGCTSLTEIPQGLLDPLVNLKDVTGLFQEIEPGNDIDHVSITIPEELFSKCTNLETAVSLF